MHSCGGDSVEMRNRQRSLSQSRDHQSSLSSRRQIRGKMRTSVRNILLIAREGVLLTAEIEEGCMSAGPRFGAP